MTNHFYLWWENDEYRIVDSSGGEKHKAASMFENVLFLRLDSGFIMLIYYVTIYNLVILHIYFIYQILY